MSFFTSLTGLNAATAQLGVTSNNIANASTVGFKRSRADFGDIFATSPLQKATSTIGQGVSLKRVTQEFGQGNMNFSSNTLDLAISGDGFFPLKSADGFQDIFTRNGSFMMNDQYNVVNSAGQRLMAASVDSTGKANLNDLNVLTIPQKTTGMAKETSLVQLGLNFPADAQVVTQSFNRNDPASYNKSTTPKHRTRVRPTPTTNGKPMCMWVKRWWLLLCNRPPIRPAAKKCMSTNTASSNQRAKWATCWSTPKPKNSP
jgi:flagellar hook-basal body protein